MPSVAETIQLAARPLTLLNDEEKMVQATVRRFARERIAPHIREMDEASVFRKDLLHEMFELGLMGIEIPEEDGGPGGNFLQAWLAVGFSSAMGPSARASV